MNGKKCKALRRIRWTGVPNGRNSTYKQLKKQYPKGVAIGGYGYYPRQGRDWRQLLQG